MEMPSPRVDLGVALRGLATSAIDVSDGLLGDLGHVLRRSKVGATLDVDAVPRSAALQTQPLDMQRECTLAGGDDYELVFTAAPARADAVVEAGRSTRTPVTRIGRIEAAGGLRLVDRSGRQVSNTYVAFDHFRS
jgi:thiamine-monophosphate kinase